MRLPFCLALLLGSCAALPAAPLSKQLDIDFYREAPNRNLKGIAVRSDGRLLDGPVVRDLPGTAPADLWWTLTRATAGDAWLLGTGPEGKVFRVTLAEKEGIQAELAADLDATHVFALAALPAGGLLAGTSPQGTLTLVQDGKPVASALLPVDSILDLLVLPGDKPAVLVATGNPGRIYRVDLTQFAAAGEGKERLGNDDALNRAGISLLGEIRDRNVRRLLRLSDGRIIAGSAPRGNVYAFNAEGGAPRLLLENREAEVTDLIAAPDGRGFYAALTVASASGEARVTRAASPVALAPKPGAEPPAEPMPDAEARPERFTGRGQLVWFPATGLPETVVSRSNLAFYRLAWHTAASRAWLLISGGEQGELLAYDPAERRSVNLGASTSAQVNAIAPIAGAPGRFLLLRNNATGLSELAFGAAATRSIETRKLDLGVPAEIGQLRFAQAAPPTGEGVSVALRTSFGSDELEGWSEWTDLRPQDGGWFAPGLLGRYVQVRVQLASGAATPVVERATLHYLPQNRRPQLTDFRVFPANLGLIPAPEPAANPTSTLGQFLNPNPRENAEPEGRRRTALLNSQLVPQPGAQFIYWTLTDPDDDNVVATFAIAPAGTEDWSDLAIDTADPYVQFDISHFAEGRYRTRLTAREIGPRPVEQRLRYAFETEGLVVDRTAPQLLAAEATRADGVWRISVEGVDALSALEGAEFILNNGARATLEHPADGILDSQRETFVAEFTAAQAAAATSVEIVVYDKAGNSAARRLNLN